MDFMEIKKKENTDNIFKEADWNPLSTPPPDRTLVYIRCRYKTQEFACVGIFVDGILRRGEMTAEQLVNSTVIGWKPIEEEK